jgi:hypothetical protein
MNADLNRCTLVARSLVTATSALAIVLVGMNSAQAQNPADLIPPAPDFYAAGNTLNRTLDYTNSLKPKNLQTVTAQTTAAQTTAAYRVIIPSDNSTLLNQAKAIEPTAFIQWLEGQRVIQVGLFSTEALALQQIARFQAIGMPVKMWRGSSLETLSTLPQTRSPSATAPTTIQATPMPFSQNPSIGSIAPNHSSNTVSNKGFYVIIPTGPAQVDEIQSQLNQVGIPRQYILFRDRPFGLHYAIGIFSKRSEAERLSDIIRDRTKFDARVYHER